MPVRVAQTEQGSGPSGAPPFATMATLSASLRHRMPLAAQPPATCAWDAPQSDTLVGELERRHEVVTCRGKRLAAVCVLLPPGACCSPGLAEARGAPRPGPCRAVDGLPCKLLLPGSC